MSKRRRASFPGSIVPGRLYRLRRGAKPTPTCCQAASAAGGAIYVEAPEASTGFFANRLQLADDTTRGAVSSASSLSSKEDRPRSGHDPSHLTHNIILHV